MNPHEYLYLQLRLEGKEIVDGDLLRQVEFIPGEDMPLMVIGFLSTREQVAYYDEALSPELREKLNGQMRSVEFPNVYSIINFLQSWGFTVEVGHYKTYVFPENHKSVAFEEVKQFSKQDPKVQAFGFNRFAEKVHVIERKGKIVSASTSARENKFCGEAWVFTNTRYRHQGLAQKVVSAWASSLISANKIPFYSHKIENTTSANLAKRLGVQPVFEEIVISYVRVSSP